MNQVSSVLHDRAGSALLGINKGIEVLFDRAPVMMHSLDGNNRIARVNRRWLQKMGYSRSEVLGRKSLDFLAEESRARAIGDTLPLFWRAGSARSVGYQFVTKGGRVVDALLDADAGSSVSRGPYTYAAIREGHDPGQSEQTSATLGALRWLTRVRDSLEAAVFAAESDDPAVARRMPRELVGSEVVGETLGALRWLTRVRDSLEAAVFAAESDDPAVARRMPRELVGPEVVGETLGALLDLVRDSSVNLRGLLRLHEEWLGETVEHQRELLALAKSIDRTLADLGDSVATVTERAARADTLAGADVVGLRVLN